MADKKITDLVNKGTAAAADIIPIVDPTDNTTKRTTVAGIATAIAANLPTGSIPFAKTSGIWWEELGRATLATASPTLNVPTFTPKAYMQIIIRLYFSGVQVVAMRLNGDSAANYADNYNIYDGNATGADINQTSFPIYGLNSGAGDMVMSRIDLNSPINQRKFLKAESYLAGPGSSGGGLPEIVWGKWNNTSSGISSLSIYDRNGLNFSIGSEVIVLGHD